MHPLTVFLLLFLGCSLGCSSPQPDSPQTFEIHHEGVHYAGLLWPTGEKFLLVCPGEVRASSASDKVNGPPWVRTVDLQWTLQDGASVHWHIEKTKTSLAFRLNETVIDLQKGHLIRVTTGPDKKIGFTQHAADLSKLQPTAARCVELASQYK